MNATAGTAALTGIVPFQDLGRLHESIADELNEAIQRVIASSGFVGAAAARSFEEAFAAAHHVGHAVGVGSGTDALALALRALGISPGDEVVVPSMTFVATAEAVLHVGATPVIVDVDPTTLLIDPIAVAAATTERTVAVMPVHLYGHVVPFDVIRGWQAQGLKVVEDAAQAHLGTWRGQGVGTVGDAWARSVTGVRSSPTTGHSPSASPSCATTGASRSTCMTRSAGARASTASRPPCSRSSCAICPSGRRPVACSPIATANGSETG